MNKTDLINLAATQAGTSKAIAGNVLEACIANITLAVAGGDDVAIPGFGTFSPAKRAARDGRNPMTGDKIKVPAKTVPKFSAGARFKAAVAVASGKAKKAKK